MLPNFICRLLNSSGLALHIGTMYSHAYNKYECTMDQELTNAAAYASGRRCVHLPDGSTA